MSIWKASWVIARRDFIATVWSKFFIVFLLAPILVTGISGLIGGMTSQSDAEAAQPRLAVAMDAESTRAVQTAHDRLSKALGRSDLPLIVRVDVQPQSRADIDALLSNKERNISAVLTGSLARPVLNGPKRSLDSLGDEARLLVSDAQRGAALAHAGIADPEPTLAKVETDQAAGGLSMVRHLLARLAQFLIFFLTMLLATTLVTNLVEEKSNKVIEVLTAAVPLDAVFLGKLIAMLGVSIIGIAVWGGLAGAALVAFKNLIGIPVTPAVGWPLFCILMLLYFVGSFMLLGAVFLGVGGQANSIREIQTLSLPITLSQVLVFLLAGATIGHETGGLTWFAAIFPLSSPLTMIGLAAQSGTIWYHFAALAWQALWVFIIIRISVRLFRRNVMKSGNAEGGKKRSGLLAILRS